MKKIFLAAIISLISLTAFAKDDVKALSDSNYATLLDDPQRPLVIEFSATWCGPCKVFAPTYHEVASEMSGKVDFFKVDVDESPSLSSAMNIQAVPTIIILNPGKDKIDVIQGVTSKEDLVKRINAIL